MLLDINELTTDQKLGMLICARNFRDEDVEFIVKMIKNHSMGCIQPFAHETEKIEKMLSAADYPILVFNDTETGFPTAKLPIIPLMSLAACGKKEYYRAYAKWISQDAREAGYNGTWGPVVDIVHNFSNIGDIPNGVHRKLSNNPEKVWQAAAEIAEVYKQNHYLSTAKHYPGGSAGFDTHMTEGFCESTEEELINNELIPYFELHKRGLMPCVMSGHTVYKNIDPDRPASLSKKVIDIIRNTIGFDGLMFTDSFAMMGILQKYGEENIYGMAIAAGNDIILPSYHTAVEDVFKMLKKNYEDGAFTEERLNEAVTRVLRAQEFVSQKPENLLPFTKEDEALLKNIAKDCITVVKDDDLDTKLTTPDKDRLFVIVGESPIGDNFQIREIAVAPWYNTDKIAEKIKKEFPDSEIEFIPEFSNQFHHIPLLKKTTKFKEIVFVTYCSYCCYLGVDELTKRTESIMNALLHSNKLSTVVHFGNPFALKNVLHIPRKVFGYMIPDSQEYAIDVLKGNIEAKGKLPYEIDFK